MCGAASRWDSQQARPAFSKCHARKSGAAASNCRITGANLRFFRSAGMAGLCASRPGKAWPGATVSLGSLLRGCAALEGRRGLASAPPQLLKKLAKLLRRFAVFAFIIAPKLSFKSTWKKPPHWDGSNQNLERSLIRFARFAAAPAVPGRRGARSPCAPRTRTRCGSSRPDRQGCRGRGRTRWRRAYSG